MSLRGIIKRRIRSNGPLPFAEYMDLSLYHREFGYYARADRRSGRTGDFFTSVDVGPLFGEFLADQFDEMWRIVRARGSCDPSRVDLVEAGAGRGRLAADVLEAFATRYRQLYAAVQLTLVERSPAARGSQIKTLGRHAAKLDSSTETMPTAITGIVFANELLDALPVHPIVMTDSGLREVYVDLDPSDNGQLIERLGPPSASVLAHVARFDVRLEPGWRAEVSPAAVRWVEGVGSSLERGFLVLFDYGHTSDELYAPSHATGTLATYRRHVVETGDDPQSSTASWLAEPGAADITAHVDLTAIQNAAEAVGLDTLGVLDQTYFLLGIGVEGWPEPEDEVAALRRRLALKTLLVPGGLGSTHKVLIFGKDVGTPHLRGCSFSVRAT